jgi:hypothetical protein
VGWTEVPGNGQTTTAPAAASIGDDVFLVMRDPSGDVMMNGGANGSFGTWYSLQFTTNAAPAIVGVGDTLYVFATRADGRIFCNTSVLGHGFGGWNEVAGNGLASTAPAAGGVGGHVFVAVGTAAQDLILNQADVAAGE